MSDPKPGKPAKPPKKDRWGQTPVAPGHVRGSATNLRRWEDVGTYGPVQVVAFDLWVDKNVPLVPVRMTATDFQGRVVEGSVYDVPDPDPQVRPLQPWRITHADNSEAEVIAHFPGREFAVKGRGLLWTIGVVLSPLVAAAVLAGLLGWQLRWFG
jgi:hypothetical protein